MQRSSPFEYCLPFVRKFILIGIPLFGLSTTLKTCFPVQSFTGYKKKQTEYELTSWGPLRDNSNERNGFEIWGEWNCNKETRQNHKRRRQPQISQWSTIDREWLPLQYEIFTTVYHCRIVDKGYMVKVQWKNDAKCHAAAWLVQKKQATLITKTWWQREPSRFERGGIFSFIICLWYTGKQLLELDTVSLVRGWEEGRASFSPATRSYLPPCVSDVV